MEENSGREVRGLEQAEMLKEEESLWEAELVIFHLSNSRLFVVQDQSHSFTARGRIQKLTNNFTYLLPIGSFLRFLVTWGTRFQPLTRKLRLY